MNILEEPFLKDQLAKAGLLGNPVYMGILSSLQSCRDAWRNKNKPNSMIGPIVEMALLTLETSMLPIDESLKKFVDVKTNGRTCFQQCILFTTWLNKYCRDNGIKDTEVLSSDFRRTDLINERTLATIATLTENARLSNTLQMLNCMVPIPSNGCNYMRLSKKAQEYVLSLGIPSTDVLMDFYDDLETRANANGGLYEAVLQLTINNKPTFIYYAYSFGCFCGLRYGRTESENEFCFDYRANPTEMKRVLDDSLDKEDIFEMRGLLANIWASIVTKSFEVDSEPSENRKYIDKLVPVPKANYSSYRYVKITPDCEEKYNESQRVINMARSDATYRKSMWFTRAYYAHRGPDKVITFCKASIHHRKCGDVVDSTEVTVLV